MSLVNDMLRDLEKRKAPEQTGSLDTGVSRESMIEPKQSSFKQKDLILVVLVILVASLFAYILMSTEESTVVSGDRDNNSELAVQSEAGLSQQAPTMPVEEQTVNEKQIAGPKLLEPALATKQTQVLQESALKEKKRVEPVASAIVEKKARTSVVEESKATKSVVAKESREVKKASDNIVTQPKVDKSTVSKGADAEPNLQTKAKTKAKPLGVVLSPSALDLKMASDAISLFEIGKPAEAYALMQAFVAENKTVDKTLSVLANRLLQDQRFNELSGLLDRAGKPLSPDLRQVKARWMLMQGEPELAVALLEQSLPDIDKMPEYFALMASLYQRNGQSGKAFEQYSQLIQSNDTVADWWAGLGIAADQLKQGRQAVFAYQQAMTLPGLNRALESYIGQRLTALSSVK